MNKYKFEATAETSKEFAKISVFYVLFNGNRVLKYSLILLFYGFIFFINGFDWAITLVPALIWSIFVYLVQKSMEKNVALSLEASGYINGEITSVQINKENIVIENKIVTYRLSPKNIYRISKVDKHIIIQLAKSRQATMLVLADTKDLYKKICDFKEQEKS